MKQNRFTEEQIVRALKELEAGRVTVAEQARKLGCSENTIYLWKKKYGGLDVNDLKELRELRQENSKLKQMVANLMLEKEAMRESCRLAGLSRVAARYRRATTNDALEGRIKELALEHNRYGYRRIWALLKREGWTVNMKRIRRLWKKNNLQVPKKKRRQRRQGNASPLFPAKALAPNHIWTLDFVHDSLRHGRRLRMLSVVDEFTREAIQIHVDYSLKSQDVQKVLEKLFRERGAPCYLRSDNGSEFIERVLNKWLRQQGTESIFITPGSPWENGKCESFNGKLRDECLNAHWFRTLREARVLIEMWRKQYNTFRPHRALGYATPLEFAVRWNSTNPSDALRAVI